METKTTIRKMLSGNHISVPKYQRAYSWDTEKQVKQFLLDVDDYIESVSNKPYYFGHFIFEKEGSNKYYIIDGQQRLTTIEIFLSAVFRKIEDLKGKLTDEKIKIKEDTIKRNPNEYRFSTVEYDNRFFKDYVIDGIKSSKKNLETLSAERIAKSFDYFKKELKNKSVEVCEKYIDTIINSVCTTHIVDEQSEAIQMFIFQNDRGKLPTKLEVYKARFMYEVQISSTIGDEDKTAKIKELQERFENIYKAIATIENNINEDDVLLYALRVYFNTLKIDVSTDKIDKELSQKESSVDFIMNFTLELENCFNSLKPFFNEKNIYEIYSLALLGKTQMIPFVIKAYEYDIPDAEKADLFAALESLILRHRIIGTRAHLEDRINGVFEKFTEEEPDVNPIINQVKEIKENGYYWTDEEFENKLNGELNHTMAIHLLWKYENHLRLQEKRGYSFIPMSQIKSPELEHIAPQTPPDCGPRKGGYGNYDQRFIDEYLDCLGNYLLISKSHNCSIGNVPFKEKRDSYNVLLQQREIQKMTEKKVVWYKSEIDKRYDKIMKFILEEL